jgi:hypothetical protein
MRKVKLDNLDPSPIRRGAKRRERRLIQRDREPRNEGRARSRTPLYAQAQLSSLEACVEAECLNLLPAQPGGVFACQILETDADAHGAVELMPVEHLANAADVDLAAEEVLRVELAVLQDAMQVLAAPG